MPVYSSYTHVRNYGTSGTEGYLNGHVIATPKVDGANCTIFFDDETNAPAVGGRNAKMTDDRKDVSWLGEWFDHNKEEAPLLKQFVTENPHLVIFGEWMGGQTKDKFNGAIKDYDKSFLRTVQIFDIFNTITDSYMEDHEWREFISTNYPEIAQYCVPIIGEFDDPTEEELWDLVEKNTYMLEGKDHPGEGIVLRNPDFKDVWGKYHIVKMVRNGWRKGANDKQKNAILEDIEKVIVAEYVSDTELAKTIQKCCVKFGDDDFDATSQKHMGFYNTMVYRDLVEENIMDMIKRYKKPTINFAKLNELTVKRAKEYLVDNGYVS